MRNKLMVLALAGLLLGVGAAFWGVADDNVISGSSGDNTQSVTKTEYFAPRNITSTATVVGPITVNTLETYNIVVTGTTNVSMCNWRAYEGANLIGGSALVFGSSVNKTFPISKTVAGSYTYEFWFRGVQGAHNWPDFTKVAITVTVVATLQPPAAPSNLVASAISSSQVNLTWQDNADNEDGFVLERAVVYEEDSPVADFGIFEVVSTLSANTTFYADTSLAYGTRYYYRLKAFNQAGDSYYTPHAYTMTYIVVDAPSNLVATAVSPSQIDLTWQDNAYNEEGFIIERGVLGVADSYKPITTIATANLGNYSDTGLYWDMRYAYRVRSYNALGQSHPSNEIEAVTLKLDAETVNTLLDQYYQDGLVQTAGINQALSSKLQSSSNSSARGNAIAAANQLNAFGNQIEAQIGKKIDAGAGQVLFQWGGILQHINAQIRSADGQSHSPNFIPVCEPITITANVGPATAGEYSWSISTTGTVNVQVVGVGVTGTLTASDPVTKTALVIHAFAPSTAVGDITVTFTITPTNSVTPTVTSKPMTAVKVDLTFRNGNGQRMSPQTENDRHNPISRTIGTDLLGVVPPTTTAHTGCIRNSMELIGTIQNVTPTIASHFDWKRDVNAKLWKFTPADAATPGKQPTLDEVKHAFGGPPAANDDSNNSDEDLTPSPTNKVYVLDSPWIVVSHPDIAGSPVGTVWTQRFYAKEWLTLCNNGDRVSAVFEWVSSTTIRKNADGSWSRVGRNEVRPVDRAGADGPNFDPEQYKAFGRDEAIAAQNE